jgi:hypothetical protein
MGDVPFGVLIPALAASAAALTWHFIAWRHLRQMRLCPAAPLTAASAPLLTLFKSLPGPADDAACRPVESFLAQLRPGDTLCLGSATDGDAPPVTQWRARFPGVHIVTVHLRPNPATPNPKVRHLRQMAEHAPEGLWLWSDADMEAPPGFLNALRAAWADRGDARLLTTPYHLPDLQHPFTLLDGAVAHLQVIPGLLLLGRRGAVDFAVGSAALFEAADFRRCVDWEELGAALADDHLLGKRLAPVRVLPLPAATPAIADSLTAAWRHALRWQRTIHSCNPKASLAHGLVLPLLAWTAALAAAPGPLTMAGLALWWVWESVWTGLCHRAAGARLSPGSLASLPLATLARSALWLAAWLPGTVRWGGGAWTLSWQRTGGARRLLPALLPWAVWAAAAPLAPGLRGLLALAAWWAAHARWTPALKPVDAVFGIHFALQVALPLPTGPAVNGLLFLMAAGSLLLQSPFTLPYAREEAPRKHWNHPLFTEANWLLALLWTAVFFFNTVWFGIDPAPPAPWNWIPPAAALAAAGACTRCLPIFYAKRMERSPAP